METGCIEYNKKLFDTPSGFASFVRKKSVNGWTSVWYEGCPLDSYREPSGGRKGKIHANATLKAFVDANILG